MIVEYAANKIGIPITTKNTAYSNVESRNQSSKRLATRHPASHEKSVRNSHSGAIIAAIHTCHQVPAATPIHTEMPIATTVSTIASTEGFRCLIDSGVLIHRIAGQLINFPACITGYSEDPSARPATSEEERSTAPRRPDALRLSQSAAGSVRLSLGVGTP